MTSRYRWSWLVLAALLAVSLLWTHRHEYAACDLDGCLRIHRWSGAITFEPTAGEEPPAADGVVVRRDARGQPARPIRLVGAGIESPAAPPGVRRAR